MDFKNYLSRHIKWSKKTFGEGDRTPGLTKHIREELEELSTAYVQYKSASNNSRMFFSVVVELRKKLLFEIVDIIILCLDIAWRIGYNVNEIEEALAEKQIENFSRQWPSNSSPEEPIKHIKE